VRTPPHNNRFDRSVLVSASTSPRGFLKDQEVSQRPLWREAFVGLDWLALRSSPVYYGLGVPRGDGSAVIVIPGFMGTDIYLQEIYSWLRRIGYRPYMSRIGWNAECVNTLVERLSETIARAQTETGGKVHLVGHSLGGVLARSATAQRPERIASVITLGSPFRGIRSHPLVLAAGERVRERIRRLNGANPPGCYTGYCGCDAVVAVQSGLPSSVSQSAIYTKSDGVVDWRVCVTDDPSINFEVTGTHVGLVFNAAVYGLIAKRLRASRMESDPPS
ncbi:MAG: alpha/beta fold hydrolase, partial [Blastocatellia bacterium]